MTSLLPIFPLNTVLYPGSLLELRIFEQRYLDMIKTCIRDNVAFGVCRILEGREVGAPALPDPVGCSAVIMEWQMPHLGLFQLRTRGENPFRLSHHEVQSNGLIMGEVEWLEDDAGEILPDSLALCRRVLEQVVHKLGPSYFLPPLAYTNPRWVSYRLAEVLPLEEEEKQHLLALRSDGERLERLHERLRQAA